MRTLVYNARPYDRDSLRHANAEFGHELDFLETRLDPRTAALAAGYPAISAFVNDDLGQATLAVLADQGVRFIALRCAGFNQVDLVSASELDLRVARVPAYSPYAVAEHTLALILTLNRRTHRAWQRVREQNFSLDGLLGFDLHGKTVGIVGTGQIGTVAARILHGFGCRLLAYDPVPNPDCQALGVEYQTFDALCRAADIVTLHCPLTPQTHHLINRACLTLMKPGVMIINTSRGGLIDTAAVIEALKSGQIGYLGLDVYEEEADLFFRDLSGQVLQDDLFARLQSFPNVLITGHQAYFTAEALANIAHSTLKNLQDFAASGHSPNEVGIEKLA
ncbi:MAG: hydroxyacid dehydrogenase [Candidatus Melainabacteria bacterium HGW-Melainabacteria-1]|nr:MAG: hydroxyacid dehydrogenase [Candidatus Melainabacteria bacterium HGW-Melainabacteria-1]